MQNGRHIPKPAHNPPAAANLAKILLLPNRRLLHLDDAQIIQSLRQLRIELDGSQEAS